MDIWTFKTRPAQRKQKRKPIWTYSFKESLLFGLVKRCGSLLELEVWTELVSSVITGNAITVLSRYQQGHELLVELRGFGMSDPCLIRCIDSGPKVSFLPGTSTGRLRGEFLGPKNEPQRGTATNWPSTDFFPTKHYIRPCMDLRCPRPTRPIFCVACVVTRRMSKDKKKIWILQNWS